MSDLSPRSGVKPKSDFGVVRAAFDAFFTVHLPSASLTSCFETQTLGIGHVDSNRRRFGYRNEAA